jgi:hypothetical protein
MLIDAIDTNPRVLSTHIAYFVACVMQRARASRMFRLIADDGVEYLS